MSEVPLYSPLTGCPGVSVTTGGEEVAFLPRVTFLEKVTFCVRVTFDDQGLAFLELAKMRPSTPACAFGVGGLGCVSLSHTLSLCLSHTLTLSPSPFAFSLSISLSLSYTEESCVRVWGWRFVDEKRDFSDQRTPPVRVDGQRERSGLTTYWSESTGSSRLL
jgi:hypothetical protein